MPELPDFKTRALAVIELAFGGPHHVESLKWLHMGEPLWQHCTFLVYGDLSTFDFSGLTRLVVGAHDYCVRASVMNGGPRRLKVQLTDRHRREGDPSTEQHPELDEHVATIRGRNGERMQTLYDAMRVKG